MKRKLKMISKVVLISLLFITMGFLFTGFVFPEKQGVADFKNSDIKITPDGKELFETRCNIYDGFKKNGAMLASSFSNIRFRYFRIYRMKTFFEKVIANFVLGSKRENALIYGAINRLRVMPKLLYSKEELMKIAIGDFQYSERRNNRKNR